MGDGLACNIRLMNRGDIPQVNEIDREAFPTLWPPANYRRELENRLAHYIVAVDDKMVRETPGGVTSWWQRIFRQRHNEKTPLVPEQYIYGFAGFWIMADEAHITNIAVRERHRREGIGQLMLISLIDLAAELKTHFVTLEVRASNIGAQNLYTKYGFVQVGVRRGYYTDNREDALLMTVADTATSDFQAMFQKLKLAHFNRWGMTSYFSAAR
jgi:[ribosomal protein S18]-alanine N-acetyltransferase